MDVEAELFKLQDKKYQALQINIVPNVDKEKIIGVRVPEIRKLAKKYKDDDSVNIFLKELPHKYYDENLLHGLIISEIKDYDRCIEEAQKFLPYVDNWAVCDTMSPKVFAKNKDKLIIKIEKWIKSSKLYTCRFGIRMLMNHFLKDDYKKEYLELPAAIHTDEYYLKMMIAWFYATALAYRWDDTIKYLDEKKLDKWTHNKTIQKAIESYRITDSQKEYLRKIKLEK